MKKRILLAAAAFLLLGAASGWQAGAQTLEKDIPYSRKGDEYSQERLKLDIYRPDGMTDCPVVVWFHGGGLTGGHKSIPEQLKGYKLVVVAVNYRLMPGVTIDQTISDAAESVAWVRKNISRYGGDPKRIYVTGHSAGGYLTMMLGFDKKWLASYGEDPGCLKALLPLSGQAISHFAYRDMLGMDALHPLVDEYAPLYWVRKDCPPVVLITGDRELELYGRYEENAYLWRMLKLAGHEEVVLHELDGFDHGGMAGPGLSLVLGYIKGRESI